MLIRSAPRIKQCQNWIVESDGADGWMDVVLQAHAMAWGECVVVSGRMGKGDGHEVSTRKCELDSKEGGVELGVRVALCW